MELAEHGRGLDALLAAELRPQVEKLLDDRRSEIGPSAGALCIGTPLDINSPGS